MGIPKDDKPSYGGRLEHISSRLTKLGHEMAEAGADRKDLQDVADAQRLVYNVYRRYIPER